MARYKSKRFGSISSAVTHIEENGLSESCSVEKIKDKNFAVVRGEGEGKQYLMANGSFDKFDKDAIWFKLQKEMESGEGSTLYKVGEDGEMKPALWWRKGKGKDKALGIQEALSAVETADIKPIPPTSPPDTAASGKGKMVVFPVADLHMGMYSWHRETGANYDVDIAVENTKKAFSTLIGRMQGDMPEVAVLAFLGDFMHVDNHKPLTPGNGNLLDTDSRYGKIFKESYKLAATLIRTAGEVFKRVEVFIVAGNHDKASMVAMQAALGAAFAECKNVNVNENYMPFMFFRFENNLLGFTHGTIAKAKLPMIMATESPFWSDCPHRVWMCGHHHQGGQIRANGCMIENIPSLCPPDAWALGLGYIRRESVMMAIVYDENHGEVLRYSAAVNLQNQE